MQWEITVLTNTRNAFFIGILIGMVLAIYISAAWWNFKLKKMEERKDDYIRERD